MEVAPSTPSIVRLMSDPPVIRGLTGREGVGPITPAVDWKSLQWADQPHYQGKPSFGLGMFGGQRVRGRWAKAQTNPRSRLDSACGVRGTAAVTWLETTEKSWTSGTEV